MNEEMLSQLLELNKAVASNTSKLDAIYTALTNHLHHSWELNLLLLTLIGGALAAWAVRHFRTNRKKAR